jgi:integrase
LHEHGIAAERQSNGDVRYSVNIMVDGQRMHRVIGRESEGCTREQAERAIEGLRTKAREGRLDLPTGRKTHRSFAEAGEDYLARIEHHPKHGRNFARKQHHLRHRLAPYFKAQRPNKLTDFSIAHYIKHRRGDGAAQATINRELATLSHFLNRALEWGWIKTKPKVDKGEEVRKQIVVLSPAQKGALTKAAEADQDPLTWLFVAIAMGTAMRHSEILRVRWDELQFDQRRIYIGRAKAGQRTQPVAPRLAARLEAEWKQLGEPDGYVFATSRADAKSPHRSTMAGQFQRTVKRAGLNPAKVTPHVLRHTAITELVQAGVDLPTIQKVSGHKTLAMVLRYTHLSDEHVDQAVANLDASGVAEEQSNNANRAGGTV